MCMPSNKRKRKISNQNKKKLPSDIDLILIKIWFNVRQCIALQQGIRIYFNVLSSRLTYLPFYKACGRTPGLMPRDKKGKEGEKKRRSDKIIFLAISHRLVVELGRSQSIKAAQTSTARWCKREGGILIANLSIILRPSKKTQNN